MCHIIFIISYCYHGNNTKKRIVILLLTTAILAPFLIFCWVCFSENTFILIILGLIFLGMILEYFAKIYEQEKTAD